VSGRSLALSTSRVMTPSRFSIRTVASMVPLKEVWPRIWALSPNGCTNEQCAPVARKMQSTEATSAPMSRGEFSSPPASTRLSVLKMIQTGSCLLSSASRLAASMMVGVDGFAPQVHGVVNHGEGKIIDPVLEAPGENATANVHAVFCCDVEHRALHHVATAILPSRGDATGGVDHPGRLAGFRRAVPRGLFMAAEEPLNQTDLEVRLERDVASAHVRVGLDSTLGFGSKVGRVSRMF
jgi:hypothetical protein